MGLTDGDEFLLRGWVWDSETRPRPARCHPYLEEGIFH